MAYSTTHGLSKRGFPTERRFLAIYYAMISRCYNPDNVKYPRYGGRGINVCKDWRDSPSNFVEWCKSQGPPLGHLLDRRDNNIGYNPDNCHFVTAQQSAINRSTTRWINDGGEQLSFSALVAKYGVVDLGTAKTRVHKLNWDPIKAVSTPPRGHKEYKRRKS